MPAETIISALRQWGLWRARQMAPRVSSNHNRVFSSPDWFVHLSRCKACSGKKQVYDIVSDGVLDCPECRGTGKEAVRYPRIDPSLIPGPSVMRVDTVPPLFDELSQAVASFGLVRRAVIMARYVYAPSATGTVRLRIANRILAENGRQDISRVVFGTVLRDAEDRLARLTGLKNC